jgi:hypothetical protein
LQAAIDELNTSQYEYLLELIGWHIFSFWL